MGDALPSSAPALPIAEAVVATVLVLLLLGATLWLLRRGLHRPTAGGAAMSVETSLSLGERRSLVIVSVDGRRLVLGLAPGHVRMVTELAPVPPKFGGVS
jgi:flagellar protein FliO/FliZ